MDKHQLEADKKLIKALFDIESMDWSRRDNGDLVFLSMQGQKFVYSDAELKPLIDKKLNEKPKHQPKPESKPKALTEEQAPYDAN